MAQIFRTTFHGGPEDGRVHRMIGAPDTWDVWTHRQAVGISQVGRSAYGGHSEEFWEHHLYRRREAGGTLGAGYAAYDYVDAAP